MDNIYADNGVIIEDRYVCRTNVEKELRSRVLTNVNSGSMSVVGMQRTGKSSILQHVFLNKKVVDELLLEKIIVVNDSMAGVAEQNGASEFFRIIIRQTFKAVRRIEVESSIEDLTFEYQSASEWKVETGSIYDIACYMEELCRLGYRTLVIADEFDNAMEIFKDCPQCFNYLRELAYRPEYNLDIVTASRRSLKEISDTATKGVSPFPNIFLPVYVKPYNKEEMWEYYHIFSKKYPYVLTKENKESIENITGGLAYWVDKLMFFMVEKLCEGEENIQIKQIYEERENSFYEAYQLLVNLLEEQELLAPLMQFEFGPVETATKADRKRLEEYGMIRVLHSANRAESEERTRTKNFSEGFRDYLYICQSSYEFAPMWNKVERGLRKLILKKLKERYKAQWAEKIREKYADEKWMDLQKAEERKKRRENLLVRNHVTEDITFLDMLASKALFRIITDEWDRMKDVFPDVGKDTWEEIANRLANARNDYAHNNSQFLSQYDRAKNRSDLEFIYGYLEKWEARDR